MMLIPHSGGVEWQMTEGLIRRERKGEEVTSERVTAGGNGKRRQRSGASIGRRGEVSDQIYWYWDDRDSLSLHIPLTLSVSSLYWSQLHVPLSLTLISTVLYHNSVFSCYLLALFALAFTFHAGLFGGEWAVSMTKQAMKWEPQNYIILSFCC